MSDRVLYYGNPINRSHPLNRGLVSEWAVVPWYASGPRFIDLAGRNHGTLTNGPTWKPISGWQSVDFSRDGSNQYVSLPAPTSFTSPYTLFAVVDVDSSDGVAAAILNWDSNDSANTRIFQFRLDTSGVLRLIAFSSGNSNGQAVGTTNVIGRGKTVIVGTWDNSNVRVYVDGREEGNAVFSSSLSNSTTVPIRLFGGGMNMGSSWTDGRCQSAGYFNRALTAGDVAAFSEELRRGNPNRWNWLSTRTYFGVTAGGGGVTIPVFRHHYVMQGAA